MVFDIHRSFRSAHNSIRTKITGMTGVEEGQNTFDICDNSFYRKFDTSTYSERYPERSVHGDGPPAPKGSAPLYSFHTQRWYQVTAIQSCDVPVITDFS